MFSWTSLFGYRFDQTQTVKNRKETLKRPSMKLRYHVEAAASELGVPPRSLRHGIHVGIIPAVRDGTGIFILAEVLRNLKTTGQFPALKQRRKSRRA